MRILFRPGQLSLLAAAKLLRVNYYTVRNMIVDGRLRGGRTHHGFWFAEAESVQARAARSKADRYRY